MPAPPCGEKPAGTGTPHTPAHAARAHSKFSASGAERWFNCPGSVRLSEGMPDKSSPWAEEGTRAHEVLEFCLRAKTERLVPVFPWSIPEEMIRHAETASDFILSKREPENEILVEKRVYLDFIHPDAFGTYDAAILDHFGTLHVFDYKYGRTYVSPQENLQMLFYAIGLAHLHHWNFKKVRMWILQPRLNLTEPAFWELPILSVRREAVPMFEKAIARVEERPEEYVEGSWCHWCKAKSVCPRKREEKNDRARSIFSIDAP